MSDVTNPSDTLPVTSMDQFIQLLAHWHQDKVAQLEHMLSVPEGTEASINDGTPMKLEGARHEGFVMGLSLALMELGTLPFAVEKSDEKAGHVH